MKLQLIIGAVLLGMAAYCPGMELTKAGKSASEIVISENASGGTLLAARDLQLHLKKISGAELRIVTPGQAKQKNLICVGESSVTRKAGYKMPHFQRSGYDIQVKGNLIVLTGPETEGKAGRSLYEKEMHEQSRLNSLHPESAFGETDCGPMHAVSAFLEHLGVRFYAPYEEGTIIPQRETVAVADFRETKTAAFARRVYSGKVRDQDYEGAQWFRRLKSGSCMKTAGVLPLAAVVKGKVPGEWAAVDENGLPLLTNDGCIFPRFTHPGFRQACVKFIRETLDADPELKELELVLPSLRGSNDARDMESWQIPNQFRQSISCNIMTEFYKAVAREVKKSHPDRILTCGNSLPDSMYRNNLPENLKFNPLRQSVVFYASRQSGKNYLKGLAALTDWQGKKPMQQREMWNEFECPATPRQGFWFMHALQQVRKGQLPYISGVKIETASDLPSNRLAEVPLTHLMYYVNSKLLWDPDLNLDELLAEYCRLWFGPAAQEMRNFLQFEENLAGQQGRRAISTLNAQFSENDLQIGFELLSSAKEKTAAGTVYRRRIEALEKALTPLKTYFSRPSPDGTRIVGKIFPEKTFCNGDFSKYGKWFVLPGSGPDTRTEFSLGVTEDRKCLAVAVRCYDPEMSKLKKAELPPDDPALFKSDHFRIDFKTLEKNGFWAAVNPWGSFADGSPDPDVVAATGSSLGWSSPSTRGWAKRYADRWEAEMLIQISGCGQLPDYGEPWGINFTRVRGRSQSGSAKPSAIRPEYHYSLTIPKVDSKNRPLSVYYRRLEPLPGIRNESVYIVKRASGPVDLSSPWDGKDWKNIPEIRMGWELIGNRSSGFRPDPRAKIQYDDQYLYVLYQVHDQYVRGNFKRDQDMVCLDSCMELFLQPVRDGSYFNFECNCIGTLLLYEFSPWGKEYKASPLQPDELREIKRFSTLPRNLYDEIKKPVTWRLGLRIPLSLFVRRAGIQLPLAGQVWYGNVYKCADRTSHPCWLMWKANETFHRPAGFGALIFEK